MHMSVVHGLLLTIWWLLRCYHLGWRWALEDSICSLWLPACLVLAEDLNSRLAPALGALKQSRADNDLIIAHDVLVVVWRATAVGAHVAVDGVACGRKRSVEFTKAKTSTNVPESPL